MTPTERPGSHKVLLVDDDDAVREMMTVTPEHKRFGVVAAANVMEALKQITTESFDVLITDLHMPNPSDGFAVITAMRHIQPKALTLLVSGYPDVKSAMDAILLEADEIIVKPFETKTLADLVHDKLVSRTPSVSTPKERVAGILQRSTGLIVEDWLTRVKQNTELSRVVLSDQERTGYLPKLIDDLIVRLRSPHITIQERRFHRFPCCRRPWQIAKVARLRLCHAGAGLTNTSSNVLWDVAEESECTGFQPAVARCYDYRG